MTTKDHNKLLAIFFFIQGGMQVFIGVMLAVVYGGIGTVFLTSVPEKEAQMVGGVFILLSLVAGGLVLFFGAFYFLAGWKMQKEQASGRIFGIIASILCLPGIPLGTALGIYGLWFLFGDQGKNFYKSGNSISSVKPPPPPNSWQ